jgi:sulfide dehydrogenase cytochrome subunit
MCKVTEGLTDTDFQALADHYSAQPFVAAPQEFDESRTALGSELYASGCQSCHGEGARGGAGPRLAGQWKRYLLATLEFVPTGEHMVPSMMERKLGEFSPDQVHALLDYLASQQD